MPTKDEAPSSSSVLPKVYAHVQPRIDPEWYQAEIPFSYEGPLTTEGRHMPNYPNLLTSFVRVSFSDLLVLQSRSN